MSRSNPHTIECRFVGALPFGGRSRTKWSRWRGYRTEKRRDQALKDLQATKPDWIEFRVGK